MSQSLVSIVLPTYNRANMLPGAIESCLNQTYQNIELIVVDDGSIDDTRRIVRRYAKYDSRVKYYKKKNEGLPKALNYGFDKASGKYFSWTSDDNFYGNDAIEIMVDALEEHDDKLVYCDYKVIDKNGVVKGVRKRGEPERIFLEPTVGACFLYSATCAKQVGEYDPDWILVEDAEFFLRFAHAYPLLHLKDVQPYSYRIHEESLASTKMVDVQMKTAKLYASYTDNMFKKMNVFSRYYHKCSFWIYKHGNTGNALQYGIMALLFNPFSKQNWFNVFRVLFSPRNGFFRLLVKPR